MQLDPCTTLFYEHLKEDITLILEEKTKHHDKESFFFLKRRVETT